MREAYIARAYAKDLAPRTIEWYERHSTTFRDWCAEEGIVFAAELRATHLDDYLIFLHARLAPHTVHGAAQVAKSMTRLGFRKGYFAREISRDFELPKVPQMIIATYTDDQLRALLGAVDQRRWTGIRDRAIPILLLDTLARISEITGLNLENVDLDERKLLVMGRVAVSASCRSVELRHRRCARTCARSRSISGAIRASSRALEDASPATGSPPRCAPTRAGPASAGFGRHRTHCATRVPSDSSWAAGTCSHCRSCSGIDP
ncbi:MAG: tyrosine-type recombinase/integrase [Actinomycetota bacterium]